MGGAGVGNLGGRGPSVAAAALLLALAAAALVAADPGPAPAAGSPADAFCEDRRNHPPIRITEDQGPRGFILGRTPSGEPIYRPGSGVVAGNGTADDPYVIRGWCITSNLYLGTLLPGLDGAAVYLGDTTAHVEVRDIVIGESSPTRREDLNYVGVELFGTENATVADSRVAASFEHNVDLRYVEDVTIRGSLLTGNENGHGVRILESTDVTLARNTLVGAEDGVDGVHVRESEDVTVADNDIRSFNHDGVGVSEAVDTRIVGNEIRSVDTGVEDLGSGTLVADNRILSPNVEAVYLSSTNATVRGNIIRDARQAVLFLGADGVEIRGNTIDGTSRSAVTNEERLEPRKRVSDVTVAGNVIRNASQTAVNLELAADAVVGGNIIRDSGGGMNLFQAPDARVANNTVIGNAGAGLDLSAVGGITVANNTIRDNGDDGVEFGAGDGLLVGNTFSRNRDASVSVGGRGFVTMRHNALGAHGLRIWGDSVDELRNDVDASNTVGGEPLRYVADAENVTIPSPAGQVLLVNTTGARVAGLHLSGTSRGLDLAFTSGTTVENNTFTGNEEAVDVAQAEGTTLRGNTLARNDRGVELRETENATLRDNDLGSSGLVLDGRKLAHYRHDLDASNTVDGHPLRYASGATDVDVLPPAGQVLLVDTIDARVADLELDNATEPIPLVRATGTTISNVVVEDGETGIKASGTQGTLFTDSHLRGNVEGVEFRHGRDTHVVDNRFVGNAEGIEALDGGHAAVRQNVLRGNDIGMLVGALSDGTIVNNTLTGHGERGLILQDTGARVAYNVFTDNPGGGIKTDDSVAADIHRNAIYGNGGPGLYVKPFVPSDPINATENWLGAADGPSGGVQDDCTGTSADGSGDDIALGYRGDVCFDPWRSSPVPGAGAD
jgi:parallel beta-helix repeat protein